MFAIGVWAYGGPEHLVPVRLPDPHAGTGEVRIRVEAAGVNPVDAMVRDGSLAGWFGDIDPPFVPGMDVAGVIDEIGEGVDPSFGLTPGQRVVAVIDNFGAYGAYSQYIAAPAASVIPRPEGASLAQAASFLMNALTALCTVDALPDLSVAPRVLVSGAAGAVGANVVALAAQDGREVIAVASPGDDKFLTAQGAAQVAHSAAAVNGTADALIDTAGTAAQLADRVRDGGTVVVVQPHVPTFGRGISVIHVNVRERITDRAALLRLRELASTGQLPLRVAGLLPARDAARSHALLARRGTRGRYVLDFTTPHAEPIAQS